MVTTQNAEPYTIAAGILWDRENATPISDLLNATTFGGQRFGDRNYSARMDWGTIRLIVRTQEFRKTAEVVLPKSISREMAADVFEQVATRNFASMLYELTGVRLDKRPTDALVPLGTVVLVPGDEAEENIADWRILIIRGLPVPV